MIEDSKDPSCNFGLPPDTMHDLLEGYVKLCTNLMLKQLIEIDKYFKLTDLNNAIQNLKQNLTKPTTITAKEMST